MAKTLAGGKLYIATSGSPLAPAAKPDELTQEQYEALSWTEIKGVGSMPQSGTETNIVSYDTIDTEVTDKAKGISDAGTGTLEVARNATDTGQNALRAAGETKFVYAFKRVMTDAPNAETTNSIFYNRGLVSGPVRPGGRNEDFDIETFTLGFVQAEIEVKPEAV